MSSILARLAAVKEQYLSRPNTEDYIPASDELDRTADTDDNDCMVGKADHDEKEEGIWLDSSNNPSKLPDLYSTKIIRTRPECLVWAKFHHFKGFATYFPCRVCDPSEAAAFPFIVYPIPEDTALIEFFNLPRSCLRFYTEKKDRLRPYYSGPPRNSSKGDTDNTAEAWSRDYDEACLETLSKRYGTRAAGKIFSTMRDTADEMLRLALMKSDIAEIELNEPSLETYGDESSEEFDLRKFASKKVRSRKETFRAGDTVKYEHQMMKFTVQSRVIAVDPDSAYPLTLESDEVLDKNAYVMRIPARYNGEEPEGNNFEYRLLGEYSFSRSRIEGVETLQAALKKEAAKGRARMERATGMVMTHRRCAEEDTPVYGVGNADTKEMRPSVICSESEGDSDRGGSRTKKRSSLFNDIVLEDGSDSVKKKSIRGSDRKKDTKRTDSLIISSPTKTILGDAIMEETPQRIKRNSKRKDKSRVCVIHVDEDISSKKKIEKQLGQSACKVDYIKNKTTDKSSPVLLERSVPRENVNVIKEEKNVVVLMDDESFTDKESSKKLYASTDKKENKRRKSELRDSLEKEKATTQNLIVLLNKEDSDFEESSPFKSIRKSEEKRIKLSSGKRK